MWIARKQSEELNHPWSLMTQPCPSHGIALACREVSCPKLPCSRRLMQDMKAQLPVSDGATLRALLAPELSAELVKALVVMALWASVQCHFLFLRVYLPRAMPPPKKPMCILLFFWEFVSRNPNLRCCPCYRSTSPNRMECPPCFQYQNPQN